MSDKADLQSNKKPELIRGIVVRYQSGFFTVDTPEGQLTAKLRGRLKRGPKIGDLVAVGEWVHLSLQQDGSAMIEEIEERKSKFSRMAPTARGEYEQVIVANPDQVLIIFSCAEPAPKMRMLDRFLIIVEERDIPVVLIANKVDLVGMKGAKDLFGHYEKIGYPVIYASANKNKGIKKIKKLLDGKVTLFVGPSGVGKSSLLNAVQPKLGLQVRSVSRATGKGKHTTVVREMFPLKDGGYVADTPGIKSLAFWDIELEEIDGYFPEIAPLVSECQYSNCTHWEEPGCAVYAAAMRGDIHPDRYESYLKLRFGEDNR